MAAYLRRPFEALPKTRRERGIGWRAELERWRTLHREMTELLAHWREALTLLAAAEDARRLEGLARLRGLETRLLSVIEQCSAEAASAEPRWLIYAEPSAWAELHDRHDRAVRLVHDAFENLRFATLDRTEEAAVSARTLAALLSEHLAFEQKLLDQIEANRAAEDRMLVSYTESGG
jgi:hypothetical protein